MAVSAGYSWRLLFIRDSFSRQQFLCESGAKWSILPAPQSDILSGIRGPPIEAANGSPIRTFGTHWVELCFSGQHFQWDFIIAKVAVTGGHEERSADQCHHRLFFELCPGSREHCWVVCDACAGRRVLSSARRCLHSCDPPPLP